MKIWVSPLVHVCRKEVSECVVEDQQKSNHDALGTVSRRQEGKGLWFRKQKSDHLYSNLPGGWQWGEEKQSDLGELDG